MYNATKPVAQKDSYVPYDQVDFLVSSPGKMILPNSFRLSGNLVVQANGSIARADADICISPYAGAHAIFRSFNTIIGGKMVESISYYPRYVAMKKEATKTQENLATNAVDVCELCAADYQETNDLLEADQSSSAPFSVKPDICINRTTGGLGYSQTGDIRVSCQLASLYELVFSANGTNQVPGLTYSVTGLTLSWIELPELKQKKGAPPVMMEVKSLIKQKLESSNATFSAVIPTPVRYVSASFISAAHAASPVYDNLATEVPTGGISRLEMTIYDSDQLIAYPLETREEILLNYMKSLGSTGKCAITQAKLQATPLATGYGVGLDLQANYPSIKFGLNMQSGVSPAAPMDVYIYARGFISL